VMWFFTVWSKTS